MKVLTKKYQNKLLLDQMKQHIVELDIVEFVNSILKKSVMDT